MLFGSRSLLSRTDRLKLAVIEDDEDVRAALGRLLRSMGHDVCLFEAAEAFDADLPGLDCLILDVRLPGQSGLEFEERVRGESTPVPVVFITGDMDVSVRERTRVINHVAAPLLTKPFSDDELMDAIERAMSNQARTRL